MALAINALSYFPVDSPQSPLLTIPDLSLKNGEWLVVWGGNGSGKTTFASILAGWVPSLLPGHLEGAVGIDSVVLADTVMICADTVQFVQQAPQWQLSGCAFTVEEEIAFGAENLGLSMENIRERTEAALQFTQCLTLRERHPATLSGGELQRVILACALVMQPKLLLLDEAFSRMTAAMARLLLNKLKALSQQNGMNIILFERHAFPVKHYCQTALFLQKYHDPLYGTIEDVLAKAQQWIIMTGSEQCTAISDGVNSGEFSP